MLEKLRRGGLDPAQVTYSIPPALRVRRASQEVTEAQVRRAIEEFLGAALGAGAGDAQVRAVELAGPVRLPLGRWQARVTVPPGVPVMGRTRLQIEFSIADRPVQSTWVTADIARFAPVVVVKRAVARGELLTADDVLVDRRDLSQVPRDVVTDPLDGAGRAARVPLLAYAPLRRSEIEAVAAVRRGDVVLLIAEGDGMRITAPGEVREDARQGDPVRVVNRMSRKEVVGHVVDAATVAVDF
ncbi:MAG: flagellar basal body P-ring formation chaperone FlgA [Candidatus Binatia bacterium]